MTKDKSIVAYKAFNPDWTCNGFKFEVGKTYTHNGRVKLCHAGFHACELPMDCWSYYPMVDDDGALYPLARVELSELSEEKQGDTKRVGARITISLELKLPDIISAQIAGVFALCKKIIGKDNSNLAASGAGSKLAASGEYSNLAASGEYSKLAASGEYSIAAAIGCNSSASAVVGSWIVLAEYDDNGHPKLVKCARIDGKKLKANTAYKLRGGKFVVAT